MGHARCARATSDVLPHRSHQFPSRQLDFYSDVISHPPIPAHCAHYHPTYSKQHLQIKGRRVSIASRDKHLLCKAQPHKDMKRIAEVDAQIPDAEGDDPDPQASQSEGDSDSSE
eukprot:4220619-Pyramimonas_sp.AAC.1